MHPELFRIGNFPIATYGLMIVIGLMSAMALSLRFARRQGINADHFYDLVFVVVFAGFLGARLLYIFLNFAQFKTDPAAMIFSREGFVFMGGFFGAVPTGIWFARMKKMPIWNTADIVAPALALAHAFGRIGCFFSGCCYGKTVGEENFWGVHFPLELGLGSAARLPSQLFESAVNFLICGILLMVWAKRKFKGQIFSLYLIFYGASRFGLEFLRGDDRERVIWANLGGLSTSQIMSILTITAGCILWGVIHTNPAPLRSRKMAHTK